MASSVALARWAAVVPRVIPTIDAAGGRVPVGCTEPGQRRHEDNAAGVGHGRGQVVDLVRRIDDAKAVAQPLDRGAGDEDRALEGVRQRAVRRAEGDRGEQALRAS